jgi:hypothetical protein
MWIRIRIRIWIRNTAQFIRVPCYIAASLCSILITVEENFMRPSIERVGFGIRIIKC